MKRKIVLSMLFIIIFNICMVSCSNTNSNGCIDGENKNTETVEVKLCNVSNPIIKNGKSKWDTVYFGSYKAIHPEPGATASLSDKKNMIRWRVLSVNDSNGDGIEDEALLLSEEILDFIPYHQDDRGNYKDITWEVSSIRQWLNNEFFENAFDEKERKAIRLKSITNSECYGKSYPDTQDKVFLLSEEETRNVRYGFESSSFFNLPCSKTLICEKDGQPKIWFLRNHIYLESANASTVMGDGLILGNGTPVYSFDIGIRPACYVQLASECLKKGKAITANRRKELKLKNIRIDKSKKCISGTLSLKNLIVIKSDDDILWKKINRIIFCSSNTHKIKRIILNKNKLKIYFNDFKKTDKINISFVSYKYINGFEKTIVVK